MRISSGIVLFFTHLAFAQQDISDAIGKFNNQKYQEAYQALSEEGNPNDASGLFYKGIMLDKGLGTPIDQQSANEVLFRSSEQGNLAARFYLANKGVTDIAPKDLAKLTKTRLSLREKMKDKGMKFYSWNDEPEYPDYWNKEYKELYDTYSEVNRKIERWAEDEALEATFIGNNKWQVGDAILYLYVDKKANPEHSWDSDWHTKYLVEGSWNYFIPHYPKSQNGSFSLSFHSKRNYENDCQFFKEVESDDVVNYERLFKSCYIQIFKKKENTERELIGSVAFVNFETAGLAYQKIARSIDQKGKNEILFMRIFVGLIIFVVGFFILKKVIMVTKKTSKRAAKKLKENISNVQENLNENRIKRKFQDAVVEETVKQQIKENNRVEEEIDKAIIKEVVKREVEGNSSIDLTKLKQDIAVALKDGEYDKVKELTDLAEKINKLK